MKVITLTLKPDSKSANALFELSSVLDGHNLTDDEKNGVARAFYLNYVLADKVETSIVPDPAPDPAV